MAAQQTATVPPKISSGAEDHGESTFFAENNASHGSQNHYTNDVAGSDNIQYPEPWKYEKFFVGGYSQTRMLNFKKAKSMYIATNIFAGEASCPLRTIRQTSENVNGH